MTTFLVLWLLALTLDALAPRVRSWLAPAPPAAPSPEEARRRRTAARLARLRAAGYDVTTPEGRARLRAAVTARRAAREANRGH